MILLAGIPTEAPIAAAMTALRELSADVEMLNQREISEVDIGYVIDNGHISGELIIGSQRWSLEEITGIYARLMDHRYISPRANSPERPPNHADRVHSALATWMELTDATVINRPSAMMSNGSKPLQAQLIRKHGFSIPETMITNDPDVAIAFVDRHADVIFKSASGVRSIVRSFAEHDRARLDAIRMCPVQFQERLRGINVRVHVVGDQVFACEATTDAVDYRYATDQVGTAATIETVKLSDELAEKCTSLSATLGLDFAGIDLLMAEDGRVVCFEVNPSPGYTYFESHTGQPISEAVAAHLAGRRDLGPRIC
jgi:glutathione synthase/RimK-type ligase-like ATP-grasp enzyme